MLTITEQILLAIKNSNKMLIDVNTLVKKPIEHKTFLKCSRFSMFFSFSGSIPYFWP